MIDALVIVVMVVYALAMLFILLHSFSDAHLIYHYIKAGKKPKHASGETDFLPLVTVQLPLYNEMYVTERLLNAVALLDYPKDKLEIQVLDDSTDETTGQLARMIENHSLQGLDIVHIRRDSRVGFKAGALAYGMTIAKGEFFAIFDADFIPEPDFLQQTIPHFSNEKTGMVQTRWGHVNKDASLLTNLQAMALDGHFTIEQHGRNAAGYFINFNGTAGVWRKQCILDAGNWQADTLTEDLDLSYRAQMRGWKFVYLQDVMAPAELPPVMSALKSQQFRWTKGGAETAKKHLRGLFASSVPFRQKWHGLFHLLNNIGFICIITCAFLTVPLVLIKEYYPEYGLFFKVATFTVVCFLIFGLHYFISFTRNLEGSFTQKLSAFAKVFPLFMSLYLGLSLNNAVGVLEGYAGKKSPFIRTPKFNTGNTATTSINNIYVHKKISMMTIIEGMLALYFLCGLVMAIALLNFASVPFLGMAMTGFAMVFIFSMKERKMLATQNMING